MSSEATELRRLLAARAQVDNALRTAICQPIGLQIASAGIAVIGVSCRFPGTIGATSYYNSLISGANLFRTPPRDRWRWCENDQICVPTFGAIEQALDFDHSLFGMSYREAEALDPHHRLLLEEVWFALENAGYLGTAHKLRRTGVFVAMYNADFCHYALPTLWDDNSQPYLATGSAHSALPNRISYLFDFEGPSEIVDTACASSLVAMHRAVQAIRAGECDQAIVGAASLLLHPARLRQLEQLGVLSSSGVCSPFDAHADGQVMGEGVAAIVLKPLERALRDRDNIKAVICATGVSHQGSRSGSLTRPSHVGQSNLVRETYQRHGLSPTSVSYIEAHGNGGIGDLSELLAFQDNFGSPVWVGSVKGNIGFLEAAGGLSQIIKVVLALANRVMPATRGHSEPISDETLRPGSCRILTQNRTLDELSRDPSAPFIAAVHGYGLGGSLAHIVLAEFRQPDSTADSPLPLPIMLSGRDLQDVQSFALTLHNWLVRDVDTTSIPDLAFTLAVGRQPFPYKAGLMVCSKSDLIRQLSSIAGGATPTAVATARTKIEHQLSSWLEGHPLDWSSVLAAGRRIDLPSTTLRRETFPLPSLSPTMEPLRSENDLGEREQATVHGYIAGWVAKYSGLTPQTIERDKPIAFYGVDSVAISSLCSAARRELGISISRSAFDERATIDQVAAALERMLGVDKRILTDTGSANTIDIRQTISLEDRDRLFRQQLLSAKSTLRIPSDRDLLRVCETHRELFDLLIDDQGSLWLFMHINDGNRFDEIALGALLDVLTAISDFEKRSPVTTLHLTHTGRHFSLGGHREVFLEAVDKGNSDAINGIADRYRALLSVVSDLRCVTIAIAYGSAQGGGLELMLATDFQIAWPGIKVGFPEIKSGLIAGMGGISYTSSLIGASAALKMNLTGDLIASETAHEMGLLTHVDSYPFTTAKSIASELPRSIASNAIRKIVNRTKFDLLRSDIDTWINVVSSGSLEREQIQEDAIIIRTTGRVTHEVLNGR